MIRGKNNVLVPLKNNSINSYCSVAFIKQNNALLNSNALINPNFLIWQRYAGLPNEDEINITYSNLGENKGYIADKWYIKNYQFGSQEIKITKDVGLFTKNQNLVNSVKISTGNTFVSALSMNIALSQDIESDKLFNILGNSVAVSFYVKSSIRGNFSCALTVFDKNNNKKHIKLQSFNIKQPNTVQKIILYFNNVNFPNLILNKREVSASLDISLSGSSFVSDNEWHTYNMSEAVVTCLSNQTNLFTGNDDYIQISNIGLQACIVGHSSFPELNDINYQKDLEECQEFFERVFIPRLNVYYKNTSEAFSYWESNFKLNTIKRNNNLIFKIKNRDSKIYYKTDKLNECDISEITNIHLYNSIGTLYNQKNCFLDIISSTVQNENILYSYLKDLIIDVE